MRSPRFDGYWEVMTVYARSAGVDQFKVSRDFPQWADVRSLPEFFANTDRLSRSVDDKTEESQPDQYGGYSSAGCRSGDFEKRITLRFQKNAPN